MSSSDSASYCQAPWGVKGSCERPSLDMIQGLGFLGPRNAFLASRHGAVRSQVWVRLRKQFAQSFQRSETRPSGATVGSKSSLIVSFLTVSHEKTAFCQPGQASCTSCIIPVHPTTAAPPCLLTGIRFSLSLMGASAWVLLCVAGVLVPTGQRSEVIGEDYTWPP